MNFSSHLTTSVKTSVIECKSTFSILPNCANKFTFIISYNEVLSIISHLFFKILIDSLWISFINFLLISGKKKWVK